MPDITWTLVLTSSVIAAVLGGLLSGFITLRVARNQYLNDYYKTVLNRRLTAYEHLEHLITMLKTSVADDNDRRVYHLLFSSGDSLEMFKTLFLVSSQSMWLSNDVVEETISLNRLLYSFPSDVSGILESAKKNYKTIAETRTRLERLHARDFLALHDVNRFLKSKRPTDSYGQLPHRA